MELLTQLGVNSTLGVQLVTFLVVFVVLKQLLFQPYYAAYVERKERTLGRTELAERFVAETRALEDQYGLRAQEANDRFRAVFDKTRGEAQKEYDRLVQQAREKAKILVEDSRVKIHREVENARTQLNQEVVGVSQLINHKLIGKELNV
jgi:F-type H+-transporting ATPase subunit b